LAANDEELSMTDGKQSKGRVRLWLDKRREARRRGAEIAERAKASRRRDSERAARHGNVGTGDPGPFGGM
jgi:hypothetical protein